MKDDSSKLPIQCEGVDEVARCSEATGLKAEHLGSVAKPFDRFVANGHVEPI